MQIIPGHARFVLGSQAKVTLAARADTESSDPSARSPNSMPAAKRRSPRACTPRKAPPSLIFERLLSSWSPRSSLFRRKSHGFGPGPPSTLAIRPPISHRLRTLSVVAATDAGSMRATTSASTNGRQPTSFPPRSTIRWSPHPCRRATRAPPLWNVGFSGQASGVIRLPCLRSDSG